MQGFLSKRHLKWLPSRWDSRSLILEGTLSLLERNIFSGIVPFCLVNVFLSVDRTPILRAFSTFTDIPTSLEIFWIKEKCSLTFVLLWFEMKMLDAPVGLFWSQGIGLSLAVVRKWLVCSVPPCRWAPRDQLLVVLVKRL